ncbi:glutamate-5-semialdehyde dehydrogenase [Gammaproteobacteria bacterium]|nr:glutamate-5-semialdehyde dehydrogenase [Gammaproteobacteria bacterium]MDC1535183.1 glutamate-5-semialdehyde dehydrogenase [Gammaproteobacteria bacterium]
MSAIEETVNQIGIQAKAASKELARISGAKKNEALLAMAKHILANEKTIITSNEKDIKNAKQKGLSESFIDRLQLDSESIASIANTLKDIASFEDPVGKVLVNWTRPNGLQISRVSTPLGVIGIIYESRPNVTADAGALCLKSGNTSILRGGSDSLHSSLAIHACLVKGLKEVGISEHAIQIINDTDREVVKLMLQGINKSIDVIVPRGGKSLVAEVEKEAKVPVFGHLEGICHIYVDKEADEDKSVNVCLNAKMRRPGICGAVETILIHKDIADSFIPLIVDALSAQACEVRGCKISQSLSDQVLPATEEDWSTEYLLPIVSIKVVESTEDAVSHIEQYSTGHTESIMTENLDTASYFQKIIDSAIVMHNTSTQFADGGEFGLGGEIGIATGKFHARGPVGIEQLTSFKYLVNGNGHIRS